MKINSIVTIISAGTFPQSTEWAEARKSVIEAISCVHWPLGSGTFTIYPESGKRSGEGNGVRPIRELAVENLKLDGWTPEHPWPVGERIRPGNMDAAKSTTRGLIAFEWETGNISSSHRSLNKMAMGLMTGHLVGGILVVPSRSLYVYLTDRIGNVSELEPYYPLWRSVPCSDGILEIVVVEHDATSTAVPRIPKGTDGWAQMRRSS